MSLFGISTNLPKKLTKFFQTTSASVTDFSKQLSGFANLSLSNGGGEFPENYLSCL